MIEVFYKEEVLKVHADGRCSPVTVHGMTLHVVRVGREGRYLGGLEATAKEAWASAYAALPKGKPGDGSGQMGLGL